MNYFIVLFLLIASSAYAEIYKWTDKNGNVHFGDRPANKEEATELSISAESKAGITNSSGDNKERARMAKELETDRKEREEKRKKFQAEKKKKKKKCALAKDRLNRYQRASGIYKLDAKGERQFYSHQQRAKKEKQLKKSVAKYCR